MIDVRTVFSSSLQQGARATDDPHFRDHERAFRYYTLMMRVYNVYAILGPALAVIGTSNRQDRSTVGSLMGRYTRKVRR